jgi:hypothetical protein
MDKLTNKVGIESVVEEAALEWLEGLGLRS